MHQNADPGGWSIQQFIGLESEEFRQLFSGNQFIKEPGRLREPPMLEALLTPFRSAAAQFFLDQKAHERQRDFTAIIKDSARVMDPLPDLRARDLRGGSVLHQIVKGHAAQAAEPGLEILNANADIGSET